MIVFAISLLACATVKEKADEQNTRFRIADTDVRLGLGYLKQGRDEDALKKLKKAVAAMPEYAEAHSSIALAYVRLGKPDKAMEHYRRAVELKPEDGSIHNNFAVFLCGEGKYEEAEQHFLTAVKSRKYPTPAQAIENLGVCMMEAKDLDKAETYLRQALKMNPRLPRSLLEMARISVEKKRLMSGRAYLQRYREVAQLGPAGLWLGIQVETKLGGRDAVTEYKNLLRQKYSDSHEMQLLLEAEEKERAGASAK